MDIGFLFGWAKEQGVKVPQKSDGSANINELFALYNEWKKKQTAARRATLRDKGVDTDGMDTLLWSRSTRSTPARRAAL